MRYAFSVIYIAMIIVMMVCIPTARKSYKPIGRSVARMQKLLVLPIIGNLIIVLSTHKIPAVIGSYIYFIGMDAFIVGLLRFSFDYCVIKWPKKRYRYMVYGIMMIDVINYMVNPIFHNAFDLEPMIVDNYPYYRLVPHAGQAFHRFLVYSVFLAVLVIFVVKMVRSSRIYMERYAIVLATLIATALLQSYFIFSRTPIDRSMAGYGVFGLVIFYFTLYYRPMTLLDRLLANMASDIPDALFFFDAYGRCIWANQPAIDLVSIPEGQFDKASELLRKKFGDPDNFEDPQWSWNTVLGKGKEAQYHYHAKRIVTDEKGKQTGSFLTIRNTTKEQKALAKERYNATHDTMTDLYTKEHLFQCIRKELDANPEEKYLVLHIDVVNFKLVNDIFGKQFGDDVLLSISRLLMRSLGENGIYGRLSGDTFGVLLPKHVLRPDQVEKDLSRFTVKDGTMEHHVLVHIGAYEVMEKDLDVQTMFDRALLAMMTIKDEYQTHIAFYDEKIRNEVLWAQQISAQLSEALRERNVVPYLQPIVDTRGKIVGAEALARWIHPKDGFLSPASFIPVFEKNGMIIEIDRYMWRCACEILAGWQKIGRDLFVSVNISPKDFYFMDINEEFANLVKEYGIDPGKLRIEITETVMMTDVEKRMRMLSDLRHAGFIVEMDDFGSGYSSLNLLKDMPVDVLKIDMTFLSKTTDDNKAKTILQNIIQLSEDLGIFSLTEGVETKDQLAMLSDMGCKLFQGYYFSKPLPMTEFEQYYLGHK